MISLEPLWASEWGSKKVPISYLMLILVAQGGIQWFATYVNMLGI